MEAREYCVLMSEYNAHMNRRTYALCGEIGEEGRRADRGAFFGSIHRTLDHLVWADRLFEMRLTGRPRVGPPVGVAEESEPDFGRLRAERERLDASLLAWAREVTPETLAAPFDFRPLSYPVAQRMPLYVLAVQMFNHQTHHRSQVLTLLTQMGVEVGSTDIPYIPFVLEELASPLPNP